MTMSGRFLNRYGNQECCLCNPYMKHLQILYQRSVCHSIPSFYLQFEAEKVSIHCRSKGKKVKNRDILVPQRPRQPVKTNHSLTHFDIALRDPCTCSFVSSIIIKVIHIAYILDSFCLWNSCSFVILVLIFVSCFYISRPWFVSTGQ